MHILFLTDNFPPESNAPASRTYEHAREWIAAGHQVTVVTCAPNFPNGRVFDGYKNKLWQSEDIEGIRVIRVWSYVTANEGFVRRILDYQSYMLTGFIASLFVRKVDIVLGTSPQFFTVVAAWATAALKQKPFVFELRDIWPESIRAVGAMKDSKVLEIFEKLELFLYRRARAIVPVTHSFKTNLITRGINPEKIHVVTNGVDSNRFSPQPKDQVLVDQLGLRDKFVAGYIGTHGMAHALDTLLAAALILQQNPAAKDVRILLIGDGASRDNLIKQAATMKLDNVIFHSSVAKNQVSRYWSLLDLSIIHLRKTNLFKSVIPSKIFECMGMGIPIALGVQGESADIIERTGAGILFEPENAQALADLILDLQQNPETRAALSENGRTGLGQFDRKALARTMLKTLKHGIETGRMQN